MLLCHAYLWSNGVHLLRGGIFSESPVALMAREVSRTDLGGIKHTKGTLHFTEESKSGIRGLRKDKGETWEELDH